MTSSYRVTTVSGVAGSCGSAVGSGTNARYSSLHGIDISPDGGYFLVVDRGNNLIKKLDTSSWISSVIGYGVTWNMPCGLKISPDGTYALIANFNANNMIKMSLPSGQCNVLVSSLNQPHGVTIVGNSGLSMEACSPGTFSNDSGNNLLSD